MYTKNELFFRMFVLFYLFGNSLCLYLRIIYVFIFTYFICDFSFSAPHKHNDNNYDNNDNNDNNESNGNDNNNDESDNTSDNDGKDNMHTIYVLFAICYPMMNLYSL